MRHLSSNSVSLISYTLYSSPVCGSPRVNTYGLKFSNSTWKQFSTIALKLNGFVWPPLNSYRTTNIPQRSRWTRPARTASMHQQTSETEASWETIRASKACWSSSIVAFLQAPSSRAPFSKITFTALNKPDKRYSTSILNRSCSSCACIRSNSACFWASSRCYDAWKKLTNRLILNGEYLDFQ